LGVVGASEAETSRAAEALRSTTTWDEHDTLPDENDLDAYLRAGPHETIPVSTDDPGPRPLGRGLRASYSRPFLAHSSIAPSCGIACWQADGTLAVLSHSQGIYLLRDAIAKTLNLDPPSV